MPILIDRKTKVLVQGITGDQGSYHTKLMLEAGTHIVGGVTPGKGGQAVDGVPVFNTVKEALKKGKATWSIIFVPALFVKNAAVESLQEGLHIVIITEHVPVYDMLSIVTLAKKRKKVIIGPNCPGIVSPGQSKIGIIPNHIVSPGPVGIISRSGTLTYEIINNLTVAGLGQSTAIGMGGDPISGLGFIEALDRFEKDKRTNVIVLIGEIGGDMEEKAAEHIKKKIKKPVIVYLAGKTAPPGKTLGHAGAVISRKSGTIAAKTAAFKKAGVKVAKTPKQVISLVKKALK